MRIKEDIANALIKGWPVVALESTIISHGMPYPSNVQTAIAVEEIIKENGAFPATIGIIEGEVVIGLTHEEIEAFAQRSDIVKVSRRDFSIVQAKKQWGATTVASTMICAHLAGIEIFVTGGIGGVHRDAQTTFDISADLQELAHTPVTVVCAGAKSILDIPLTLEYLETFGVPVLGYQSDEFAAFYSPSSGYPVDARVDDVTQVAQIISHQRQLKNAGGILISNPILAEDAIDKERIDKVIEVALQQMKKQNVVGKEVTPFLLKAVKEATMGESLIANIRLIENNAKIGAKIAVALAMHRKEQHV